MKQTGLNMPSSRHICPLGFFIVTLLFCWTPCSASSSPSKNQHFPVYRVIEPNVNFWEKIYTLYSTREAVIHDREDLSKIFCVVSLLDDLQPNAQQINKSRIDAAKTKYSAVLSNLARNNPSSTPEERQVAAMYAGANAKRLQQASESLRAQLGQKERFREGVIRSGAYLPEIKRIFREQNLPEELAYLPHVESSFNPNAYSKAGASGLWQFTPSTGKKYLRIDQRVDERQDPITASHAAAKFLKHNYSVLNSWPLALTAYNYGTAGMVRAQKDKGSYERIFREYDEGHFKFASRNFYPEFLAALRAAKKLEQDPSLRRHSPTPATTILLTGNTSISTISKRYRVSIDTLKRLNPAIKLVVFTGKQQLPRGYPLRLPASAALNKTQTATAEKQSRHNL